jgi:hypothetical protein
MLCFLDNAKNGINMNLIVFFQPTHVYRLDSCPFGLGGYSGKGFAWRFKMHVPHAHTQPTVSHLNPKQCNHPENIETQRNLGGDMA